MCCSSVIQYASIVQAILLVVPAEDYPVPSHITVLAITINDETGDDEV